MIEEGRNNSGPRRTVRESPELKQAFDGWLESRGGKIQDEHAGAYTIWPLLPASLRVIAKRAARGDREAQELLAECMREFRRVLAQSWPDGLPGE